MFDVSFTEMLVIGVIALIVIGPERLPKVARTVGHLLGRAQRYVSDVKTDIRREIELDELRKFKDQMQDAASSVQSSLRDTSASLRAPLDDLSRSFSETGDALRKDMEGTSDTQADPQAIQASEDVPPLTTPPGTPEDTDTPPSSVAGGASELPEPVRAPATAQAQPMAPAPVTPLPPSPEPASPAESAEADSAQQARATPQTPNGSPT
ncbi:Twin-arginine translocation protein TatB [plant metagenome]|uniref:Twin-arginine translocation protein TatB n=1 Tax=plant metagenome TaxID=1297885 RepID=A0A484V5E4_9ZZZZ